MLYKDQILGKYQIVNCLGTGGFGSVYLANDILLRRKVAIKIPHHQIDQQELLSEPRIMAVLKHPNIVEIITVEKIEDVFFIVMEYIDGKSLDQIIRQKHVLTPIRSLEIAIDVCLAIEFAHTNQIVHQDLRAANILITKEGLAKITDFGTSKSLKLQHGEHINKQLFSEKNHKQSVFQNDLRSIGIVLYQMLTGMLPFDNINYINAINSTKNISIIPPHLRQPSVSKLLSDVVMKIIAINLNDPCLSIEELLEVLREVKNNIAKGENNLVEVNVGKALANIKHNNVDTQLNICRFCYRPLPRLAVNCPICGEISR